MRPCSVTALLLALLAAAPSLVQPAYAGGAALPPLELEVGRSAVAVGDGSNVGATEVLVGVSLASVYPKPTPVDVTAGWVGSFVADDDASSVARGGEPVASPSWRPHDASGAFISLDLRAAQGRHWRAWLGGRGELLGTEDVGILGGFGRASLELWHPVAAGDGGGAIIGTIAIAAWMEVGARERPDRSLARVASAGLAVRLPLVVAR